MYAFSICIKENYMTMSREELQSKAANQKDKIIISTVASRILCIQKDNKNSLAYTVLWTMKISAFVING